MKDVSIYSEDVFNVSHSDSQQVLKDIRKSNVNKLIFGQLNINSLRNIHLSGLTEIAVVVTFFFTSARTYQQKSCTVIFQLPKVFFVYIYLHKLFL